MVCQWSAERLKRRDVKTYGCSPDRHRVHVTLALTSTTTVSVVCGVHGKTTDSWPDVQKSAATSLSELPELPGRVAGYTNSGTSFRADSAHLTTLQAHSDISDDAVDVVLCNHCGVCASTATEHCALVCCAANVKHLCSHRHHLHGQAVSAESGLRCQHTGIHHTTHARK